VRVTNYLREELGSSTIPAAACSRLSPSPPRTQLLFAGCWGTLSETFSKLGDGIYFKSADNSTLYVNLFASSTLTWARPGGTAVVTQDAGFPVSTTSTTIITIDSVDAGAASFTVAVRVPFWAVGEGNVFSVNGVPVTPAPVAGTYATITRTWAAGDRVDVFWAPFVRWEALNDARPEWAGVGSVLYGSILLAGLTSTNSLGDVDPNRIADLVVRTTPDALNFTAPSLCGNMTMVPLMDVMFESYTVYFFSGDGSPVIGFNASGASTLDGSAHQWTATNGAGVVSNGPDMNLRSGDAGEVTTASWLSIVQDDSHSITGLNFTFEYVSGYGPAGRHVGANFTLVVTDVCGGDVSAPLYQSPEFTQYPFDVCNTCYSPPVNILLAPGTLKIDVSTQKRFSLLFNNNDRNIQINLPSDLTIYWSS
jgi:hypothetical protein